MLTAEQLLSYRDALLVQFAFGLASILPMDFATRQPGGRSVAGWLGTYLESKHIRGVKDAFQNIGKNSNQLARGNFEAFDRVLRWASMPARTHAEIRTAFEYTCAYVASRARPTAAMPRLDRSALTHEAICRLLVSLFDMSSGGAYEQFVVASLLHALLELQGTASYRVETKNLNASDKSSRTAGDVQVVIGQRVVEAIEVTANDWRTKIGGAAKTIKDNDLSRLTILARGVSDAGSDAFDEVRKTGLDISVLELRQFCFSVAAALTKPARASALVRLYELIDRNQPRYELVNDLCAALVAHKLTEMSTR